jgi:hypothetical protein
VLGATMARARAASATAVLGHEPPTGLTGAAA